MSFKAFIQKTIATKGVKHWFFKRMGYNKYGLYYNDIFDERMPEIQEAVRRLPREINDARIYRILRAQQLTLTHTILPPEQWTKFEDDLNNRYLEPYIEEVNKENKEKKQWAKTH
ncbi:hypothetical protein JTE90_009044 [Oedothorax gibbosus]|uniref:Cytochrome b-c1 complex subunit 7 n=1 Tax=Oedothorax gibbosus TaxID=931172 RepID=A0AAV6VL64_9ARAC|nr:hypothetical protein JTE90_009044 [Oedothorax gibbosus]